MDRLVCGDVGFGKTEVALRAAFIAVMGGKQVALLSPTTLLAEQHTQTFTDRFSDWPVRIAELSRFRSTKEVNASIQQINDGGVDIVIARTSCCRRTCISSGSGWSSSTKNIASACGRRKR